LTVVYAGGSNPGAIPRGGGNWKSRWISKRPRHGPGAQIYLVEANSAYDTDLYPAVQTGANLVYCGATTCPSGGHGREKSAWLGEPEFSNEALADGFFEHHGVVYFAAAGDAPGVEYPCASPNVVCVGGTSTARSIFTGNFLYQVAWQDAGGGFSDYEPRPFYQNPIRSIVGSTRGVPDVSFDGNPNTGTWIYDSNAYEYAPGEFETGGWFIAGGTSLGSPAMAGIVNAAGHFTGRRPKNSKLFTPTLTMRPALRILRMEPAGHT